MAILPAVSLDQLRYFVAVAESGSTQSAARSLHISQPPLSRQIRALEEELGVQLFERSARGMQLRPAGSRFLERTRYLLSTLSRAIDEARASGGLEHTTLSSDDRHSPQKVRTSGEVPAS